MLRQTLETLGDKDVRTVVLTAPFVTAIVSCLVPVLNGLLTSYTLPSLAKLAITAVLNFIEVVVISGITSDGIAVISQTTFLNWLYAFVVSLVAYDKVLKKAHITNAPADKLPSGWLLSKTAA